MAGVMEFKLPDVGEGLTEAEIVRWHVRPGDRVEINQIIMEIETAKAVVELPCPYEGVVTGLLVEEGRTVDVGTPLITVDTSSGGTSSDGAPFDEASSGEAATAPAAQRAAPDAAPPKTPQEETAPATADAGSGEPGRQPVLVGYGVKPGTTRRRPRKRRPTAPPARPAGAAARALAKPPVRKLARDLGVDLSTVEASGPHGTITRDDVHRAARQRADAAALGRAAPQEPPAGAPAAPSASPREAAPASGADTGPREERIPVKGVRKSTATAMVRSAFTAPQVTEFLQVDVTETMETVRRLRELPEFADVKVSPLLLVAKALLTAVRRHPMINSSWVDGNGAGDEIVVKRYINLGIAVATPRGLLVPNVKNADRLTLPELAAALGELTETARAGRTRPADMTGGTITITNIGVFGVDGGTPILTPGESAILAVGQIRDMPWVHEGELAVRKVTTLALSFDHRVVDGELGSAVLRDVGAMLENPLRMLAWS